MNPEPGLWSRSFGHLMSVLHIRETSPLNQPVNFFLSATLILLFGLTATSLVIDKAEFRDFNPLTNLGEGIALTVLYGYYGNEAMKDVIR